MYNMQGIRHDLLNADHFNSKILNFIADKNWLNIWVPKKYNGLGLSFSEGLKTLQEIAKIDGSLGWFITLCSGANYFSRNLNPEVATQLFSTQKICFGGSGMLGGTAEKIEDDYIINGLWHYATGAPYLTHFTLNAQIIENGEPILDENNEPRFLSFVLNKSQVELIPTWKSMGMIATSSHSFEVKNQKVHQDYSFIYNEFYSDDLVEKIPFKIFADLTLLVNYIGMADHFLEKSFEQITTDSQSEFSHYLFKQSNQVQLYASKIEDLLIKEQSISEELTQEVHHFGETVVEQLTLKIIQLYPLLGIKASKINEEINQVFRDFFTATQHRNFRKQTP